MTRYFCEHCDKEMWVGKHHECVPPPPTEIPKSVAVDIAVRTYIQESAAFVVQSGKFTSACKDLRRILGKNVVYETTANGSTYSVTADTEGNFDVQEIDTKHRCPQCGRQGEMFTSDLDRCEKCNIDYAGT